MFDFLIKGILIGFAIAAPVGPIGVLCIQRSVHNGFKAGLVSGLGAASADGIYGLIAGFGLTAVASLLITHQFWIRLVGGLFLIYLGIKLLLVNRNAEPPNLKNTTKSLVNSYTTTFFLTLTNPATILSFVAIFAGLGLGDTQGNYHDAFLLILGVMIGSTAWWLILSSSAAFILHGKMNKKLTQIINWISGSIILLFGIIAVVMSKSS